LGAEEQVVLVEDVAEGDEQQEDAAEHREVRARRPRESERGPAGDAEVAARDSARRDTDDTAYRVDRDHACGDDENGGDRPTSRELEDRQREEVEADVAPEDRIAHAERDGVEPAEQLIPLIATRDPEEEGRDRDDPEEPQRLRERGRPRTLRV